jgi:hypothetical protein
MKLTFILLALLPCTFALFALTNGRRAAIASLLIAWLFLPVHNIELPNIPDLNKMSIAAISVLLGSTCFDGGKPFKTKPRWFDIPALIVCLCPILSSWTNGLGMYDGLSTALESVFRFGLFYWIGRTYFNNLVAVRELAAGILVGGIIYVPFCIFEMVFSPQLHNIVYGFHAQKFSMALRFGGYRPSVFMESGLALGMWLAATALLAIWMWYHRSFRRLWGVPFVYYVPVLLGTFILSRAAGAYMAFFIGVSVLTACRTFKASWPLMGLVLLIAMYLFLRSTGLWSGTQLITVAERVFGADRASSLEVRIRNDSEMSAKARERVMFGWGGWGRFRMKDDQGNDISTTDTMWIIMYGQRGLIGLASVYTLYLLPVVGVCRRFPVRMWNHPLVAPVIACAVILCTFMIDCLMNDMPNPLFTMTAGALAGIRPVVPAVIVRPREQIVQSQESWLV